MLGLDDTNIYRIKSDQIYHIGRHNSNQIIIYDESISRLHTEIYFDNYEKEFKVK